MLLLTVNILKRKHQSFISIAMANDREVLREIWDGKIPVCFTLDSEETCELQGPDPFYLMIPRLSYFPLCTEKVRITMYYAI